MTQVISVSGLLGAGKTTLAHRLSAVTELGLLGEPVESLHFLPAFHNEPSRWAFTLQVAFCTQRVGGWRASERPDPFLLSDRSLHEDRHVFVPLLARLGHLTPSERDCYIRLYDLLGAPAYPALAGVVFLECPPIIAWTRLQARNRLADSAATVSYLEALSQQYEEWLGDLMHKGLPVIRCDSTAVDFRKDSSAVDQALGRMRDELARLTSP